MSEFELTETGDRYQNKTTNISEGKEENGVKEKRNGFFLERVKNLFKFLTVEPLLLCFVLPSAIASTTISKFFLEKACRTELNFTEEICALVLSGNVTDDDNITTAAMNDAQRLSTGVKHWSNPLQSGIPAIIILFIGAWSDRTGNRKFLMFLPIIGELTSFVGLLLATYFFFEWPLWVAVLVRLIPISFSGGSSVILMGSFSYIADVTTIESRTFRIGVLVVIVTLGAPIGIAVGGVLTKKIGYYGIFGIGVVIYVLTFFLAYFTIHDVKRVPMKGTFGEKLKDFFQFKHAWETISFLFKSPRAQLKQIILVIVTHIVIMGPDYAEVAIMYEYALKKYKMDEEELSYFYTYAILLGAAGNSTTLWVFNKSLKLHDASIGAIVIISKVMSSFVYSLAPTKTWIYVAPIVNFFGTSGPSIIKSLGTKVVDQDKVGKMVSLLGLVEAIVPSIYTPIYIKVYKSTLESFSGAFFLLGAAMTVPAFFIFIFLYVIQKRQERDRVQNPDEKERHAHENHATAL